jgi:hypothetical protein
MTVLRMICFSLLDPAESETMLTKRADLIAAVRANFPGLTETRLARVDDETWLGQWIWDSVESLETAHHNGEVGAPRSRPLLQMYPNWGAIAVCRTVRGPGPGVGAGFYDRRTDDLLR